MQVTNELVNKLAQLSKLSFDEQQVEKIKTDLTNMISFVDELQSVDTTGVQPLLHMTENVNVLRADEIKGSINNQQGMLNAPKHDEAHFLVPKVIKK